MNYPRCRIPGCSEHTRSERLPLCPGHWNRLPYDLQERLRFAIWEGSSEELTAALHACAEELS